MNITVSNKDYDHLLTTAAFFFGQILFTPSVLKSVYIDIVVDGNLKEHGTCFCDDEPRIKRPKFFTIKLRPPTLEFPDPIEKTLAHEMVHIKQYASGQLRDVDGKIYWNGKIWRKSKFEDSYLDAPWEVEAYGREQTLFLRWEANKNNLLSNRIELD